MGLVLLCVIWLITFASTYFFIAKTWWLPAGVSAAAASIDHQFAITFVIMGVMFSGRPNGVGICRLADIALRPPRPKPHIPMATPNWKSSGRRSPPYFSLG